MKKKKILKKKIVSLAIAMALSLSMLGGGAISAFATESETDEQDLKNADTSWLSGSLGEQELFYALPAEKGSDDITALGGYVGYDVANSKNYCSGNNEDVKNGTAKKGSGSEPTLKITAKITFPTLGKGFYYKSGDTISVSLCKDVDNSKSTGMGWSTCSTTTDQAGHTVPSSYPNYGALGCMVTRLSGTSGEAKYHRKKTNHYFFDHPNGFKSDGSIAGYSHYKWSSYTTQITTGYKNANLFALAGKKITVDTGKTIPNAINYSDTLTYAEYKKVIAWCKNFKIPTETKTVDGVTTTYYKAKIAVSYDAPVAGNSYAISGCSQHGQMIMSSYTCNCMPGFSHMRVNNCSSCTVVSNNFQTGNMGSSFKNSSNINQIDSGNGTEYINNPKECRVIAYGDVLIPQISTPVEIDLKDIAVERGGTIAAYTEEKQLNSTEYATKEVTSGTAVTTATYWGAAASYDGYTFIGTVPADGTAVTNDTEFHRLYTPSTYTVSCVDKFFKAGQLVAGPTATPGGAKTYYYGDVAKGSDWGTTSPDANYDYAAETSVVVTGANLTVERHFSLGTATIQYHSNIPDADTTSDVSIYPGDLHTTKGADTFTRGSTYGSGWKLVGWSDNPGATNTVNYTCGQANLNFGLSRGDVKHLYAVWQPTLKVEFADGGFESFTVNGEKFPGNTEAIKQYAYGTAATATAMKMNGTNLFQKAELDGQAIDLKAIMESGSKQITAMTDCHTLKLYSTFHAALPTKNVYKSGTTTDVDKCVVNVGDELDYVITVNNTTSVNRNVAVTDVLDEGLDFISSEPAATPNGRTLSWLVQDVEPNKSKTIRIKVRVNEKKKGSAVINTATAIEKGIALLGESDGDPEPTREVTNYVMTPPEKHLRKTAETVDNIDETIVVPKEKAFYTIKVDNPALADKPFDVSDVIPDGLTIKSVSDGGTVSGQKVTWSGASISRSSSKVFTVEVEVNDRMQGDTILNSADVTCKDAMNSKVTSNEVENYIMKAPDKSVYLTLNDDGSVNTTKENIDEEVINDGILLTYKIDWKNPTAKNRTIILKDTLPENTRIATTADLDKATEGYDLSEDYNYVDGGSFLITDGGVYDEATRTITWTIESGAAVGNAKDNGYVEFSVVVLKPAQDTYLTNYATQTVVSPTGINENNPTMDSNIVRNPVLKTPHKIAKRGEQDVTDLVVNDTEEITYHITFKNPADKTKNFTVTDIVPEFTELIDGTISDGGEYDAKENLITWKLALEAGEEKTVSFTVRVMEEGQNETVKNTARVYVDRAKVTTDKDIPTKIYILEDPKKAVLNIEGEDINGVVKRAGDIITYNIIYKNPADDERVATITDVLPDGLEFVSATNQGSYDVENEQFVETSGSCTYNYDPETNTVVWTAPTAGKCQEMMSVDVRILPSARGKILRNTASVYIPDATKQTNEVITPVVDNPDKVATDKDGQDLNGNLVTIGEEFTYSITVENPAEEAKEGYITDTLPEGVDFVACSEKGFYDANTHTVFWKKVPLKAKEKYTVTIDVVVNEKAKCTIIENNAVFRIDEATVSTKLEDGGDGGPRSYVTAKEVLNKKGEDIDTKVVASGSTILYKISYKNITDKERFFTIVDEIPEGEEIVEIGDNGFVCKQPLEGFLDRPLTKNTVGWQFYVPAGQEGYVTVTTKVTATKECTLKNHATIRVTDDASDERAFVKDTNIVINPVIPYPVKMVFNEDGREITDKMVTTGDVLTYTITYINPADDVRYADIIDILPNEVKFVSCEDGGVYDEGSHTVKWTDIESQPHEKTTVSFVVKVKDSAGGKVISNKGTLAMDEAIINTRAKTSGSDPEDPQPSDKPTVDNYVAYKRSLDANENDISGEVVKVGDTLTYCISYANTSSVEKQYRIKDTLPEEVDYVSATGDPAIEGKTLTWNVTAKPGTSGHLDVVVTINEKGYGKKITNKATITEFDPEQPNDPYTITTTAVNNYVFDKDDFVKGVKDKAGKDMDGGVAVAGTKLFYTIKLHNPADTKKEFTVTDALPAEVVYSSCSDGGKYDEAAHTVSWELELEGDATAELEICVKIKNSMTSGEIRNMAHLVTKGTEMDSNEVTTLVFAAPVKKQYSGSVEIQDGEEVECNDEVTYTISFENPSSKEMEIIVTDDLDADIAERVLEISDGGKLKNGKIEWAVDVPANSAGEVSFTVSAPDVDGITVSNIALITYDDEDMRGKNGYKTNEVTFVTRDKAKDTASDPNDARKNPEIVKTGDSVFGTLNR